MVEITERFVVGGRLEQPDRPVVLIRGVDSPEDGPFGLVGGVSKHGRIELVRRAKAPRKPQRQDFEMGDVIDPETLARVMWCHGTVVIDCDEDGLAAEGDPGWTLRPDGKWYSLCHNSSLDIGVSFDMMTTTADHFFLAYLPEG